MTNQIGRYTVSGPELYIRPDGTEVVFPDDGAAQMLHPVIIQVEIPDHGMVDVLDLVNTYIDAQEDRS